MAHVIARILVYNTPMLFSRLACQNWLQSVKKPPQLQKSSGQHPIVATTEVANAPETPQEVPRELSQRDRDMTVLFYFTPRVKADGEKLRGCIALEAAQNFHTSLSSVKRAWQKYGVQSLCLNPSVVDPIVVGRKNGSGGKKKRNPMVIKAAMKETSFSQRRTLRSLAKAINVPKSIVHRMLRLGQIKRHSSAIRPILTADNIQARIDYCASFVDPSCRLFSHLLDMVYVNEKWFYMTEITATYYIAPDEISPDRRCKHKSHI